MSVRGERTSGGKHFCYVHLKCEINLVTDKMKTKNTTLSEQFQNLIEKSQKEANAVP